MNKINTEEFDSIRELAGADGVAATLTRLAATLKADRQYHQMFEALKMTTRHRLGLPLVYDQRPENLDAKKQNELEDGLLEACREVGLLLVADNKLREGWIYLQPLGDRELVQTLIADYEVTDDNVDEVIDVALMQQAAPAIGYALVLERYGTCNAITSFDSAAQTHDLQTKKELAGLLVNHLHDELVGNLKGYLADNDRPAPDDATLAELVRSNKPLLAGAGPMSDATHLASLMRIGRNVSDRKTLIRLKEMAEYGCQLAEPFHFPGDSPFEKTYRDHLTFYRALISDDPESADVKQAIQFFDQKSLASAGDSFNPIADEVFVDFLFRLDRNQQAIEVSLERLTKRSDLAGIAPQVYQMAREPSHFQLLEKHYKEKGDLLGFAVSVLMQNETPS